MGKPLIFLVKDATTSGVETLSANVVRLQTREFRKYRLWRRRGMVSVTVSLLVSRSKAHSATSSLKHAEPRLRTAFLIVKCFRAGGALMQAAGRVAVSYPGGLRLQILLPRLQSLLPRLQPLLPRLQSLLRASSLCC